MQNVVKFILLMALLAITMGSSIQQPADGLSSSVEDKTSGAKERDLRTSLTQEESDAIDRLANLGFSKQAATEAYFACDKDEQCAAKYLREHAAARR